MPKSVTRLPVTILRGGTSKGVYILETDLPADKAQWEPLLLRLMGSPDKKQIDGLGGSQSVTSKVAIGFIKKVNLGFLSLGAAFILGTVGGMTAKQITAGFDSSMFVTLVGVTFLFGMASQNGTLDLFSKKIVALVGKHTVLIPVLMFLLSVANVCLNVLLAALGVFSLAGLFS